MTDGKTTAKTPTAAEATNPSHVPEIQGLRTIALLMVATFHIWFDRISGGVDVFLVISAYLLTRSLVARAESGYLTRPVSFIVRKFARLVPAAAATIGFTLLTAYVLLPAWMWPGIARDAIPAALYTENWHLQALQADYFANSVANASLFQQFWSLAIQGQVFILWPILHVLTELVARATKTSVRRLLIAVFGLIFVASISWSVWLTAADQQHAYFDTGARLWEFAGGSLLALLQPWLRFGMGVRAIMSWLGLIGVLSCGIVLPVEATFPGFAALWPLISTALVIVAADGLSAKWSAHWLLSNKGLAALARYSYALYLTHWPVLVMFAILTGVDQPGAHEGLFILLMAGAFAVAIYRFVENPLSKWVANAGPSTPHSPKLLFPLLRPAAVIALCTAVALVATTGIRTTSARGDQEYLAFIAEVNASQFGPNTDPKLPPPVLPTTLDAADDAREPGIPCAPDDPYSSQNCFIVEAIAGDSSERSIFALGNSHIYVSSGMYLESVYANENYAARTQYVWSCTIDRVDDLGHLCGALWESGANYIAHERPDLVIVFGTQSTPEGEIPQWNLIDWIRSAKLSSPETQFVVIRDTPRFETAPLECLLRNGIGAAACETPLTGSTDPKFLEALSALEVVWVDLNDQICPDGVCSPVVGGLVTYADRNHITDVFARSLATSFDAQVAEKVSWWNADR